MVIKNVYSNTEVIITVARLSLFFPRPKSRAQKKVMEELAVRAVTGAFNAWFYNA